MTTAGINTKPPIGVLRFRSRSNEAMDIQVGTLVRTPMGRDAMVIAHRGKRRGPRVWLVCRYVAPANRAFDVVLLLPELVEVI